uniref:Uncharacterized protein n=1 Tax=Lepeophtheirus salmonis TaxID=72036 RepID=A0A0K2VA91_LEPSM
MLCSDNFIANFPCSLDNLTTHFCNIP